MFKISVCLDKGYDSKGIEYNNVVERGYISHIRYRCRKSASAIGKGSHHNSRRWVVERTNSWHNRFRKRLIRYEKSIEIYFALVCFGCCIVIYRRIILG
jgi:transposase